jgi:peptidoglycan/LPS O-acetylase OafA/YrhL
MAQLDALRTFAVAAVMVHHYTPSGWGFGGTGGVRLFFSLSGFLITGILLRSRERLESSELTLARALGRFYARRTLRIFPLYYFVIAAALALGLPPTRRLLGWLVTYTLNFHMARQGWYEESFAHFWSLAVEEQFYLAWPWLILALPRRLVLPAVLATIAVSPAYRLRYVLSGYTSVTGLATYISTLTCLDALGAGALLALLWRSVSRQRLLWFVRWLLLPGSLLLMFLLSRLENWHFGLVCGPLVFALLSTSVIALAAAGLGAVALPWAHQLRALRLPSLHAERGPSPDGQARPGASRARRRRRCPGHAADGGRGLAVVVRARAPAERPEATLRGLTTRSHDAPLERLGHGLGPVYRRSPA